VGFDTGDAEGFGQEAESGFDGFTDAQKGLMNGLFRAVVWHVAAQRSLEINAVRSHVLFPLFPDKPFAADQRTFDGTDDFHCQNLHVRQRRRKATATQRPVPRDLCVNFIFVLGDDFYEKPGFVDAKHCVCVFFINLAALVATVSGEGDIGC
jgi:hypothetical protein